MDQKKHITHEGLCKLEEELELLTTVKRKQVSEKIKVALSFGDLSENSEYDEAKNEQAMLEARISEIELTLKNVVVISEDEISTERVSFGSTVTIKCFKNDKVDTYQIVGSSEAIPMEKKISDESPVGRAIMGHKVGQVVEVETPSGIVSYEILEITK